MRVCVIGAGVGGLTAAKHLLEKGFEVELLEKRDGIGGLWYFSKNATGVASNTIATSSKTYLQFSDVPFENDMPHFPHHTDYLKYLKTFAEKFNILPLIKFNHEVTRLRKIGDKWEITVKHGNDSYTQTSDAVVVSAGIHHVPLIPEIPGKENYTGLETHSGWLKTGEDVKGKRVVVMGVGESGADFAHYLTSYASEVYLSIRRGVVVLPRWSAPGMPADFDASRAKVWLPREFLHDYNLGCYPGFPMRQYSAFRTFFSLLALPAWIATLPIAFNNSIDFIKSLFDWNMWVALFKRHPRHGEASGIGLSKDCAELCKEPPKDEAEAEERYWRLMATFEWHSGAIHNAQTYTKSSDFLKDIAYGKVKVLPGITRYNGGKKVEFEDGTNKEIDAVVMCTGYHGVLPFLETPSVDNRKLYKHVFIPGEPTLAFIGFARPNVGALPPLSEMQARWFARVLAGEVSLPDAETMEKIAQADAEAHAKPRVGYSKRSYISATVDYQKYLDELAGLVGCRPNILLLLTKPKLLWAVLFGPLASFQYRLHGDGANLEAAMKVVSQLPPYPTERLARDIALLLFVKPWFKLLAALGFQRFRPVL